MAVKLTEGSTYLVKATTTNMSTKAGVPIAAALIVNIAAVVNSQAIMEDSAVYGFAAGETRTFEFSMAVPMGTGGKAGAVVAEVLDPNGNKLADGSLDVVIAPAVPLVPCVYCGAPFTTESDLVAHMEANHPGKPYVVWAYLPEENVLLTPAQSYSIKAKVYAPATVVGERYIFAFWSYRWECIAAWINVGGGTPAGFYLGEASSYHCYHRLGRWYCPPLGENTVYSDCYLAGLDRWYSNPVWKSVDIGLRVNFTA